MGSRVLVYRGDADLTKDVPLACLYTSGMRLAPGPAMTLDLWGQAPWREIGDAFSEARGPDGRLSQPNDPRPEEFPSFRDWEAAFFAIWSARVIEGLRRRGLIGVPQGYSVHTKPETARFRFRHGAIVAHPTPRRGPANRTR